MIPKFLKAAIKRRKNHLLRGRRWISAPCLSAFPNFRVQILFPLPSEELLLTGSEVAERFGSLTYEIEICGKEVGY